MTHDITIPDTRYCPEAPFRLLCPQHLAQQSNEPSSVLCLTTHQQVSLSWRGFTKTIPLLDGSNVALFRSSAGFSAAMALMEDRSQPVCFESHVRPNDKSDDADENTSSITRDHPTNQEGTRKIDENTAPITDAPDKPNVINDDLTSFDVELAAAAEELEEKDIYEQSPTNKLLIWHYRLNHLPFSRLQAMANEEISHRTLPPAPSPSVRHATMPRQPEDHGEPRDRGSRGRYRRSRRQETVLALINWNHLHQASSLNFAVFLPKKGSTTAPWSSSIITPECHSSTCRSPPTHVRRSRQKQHLKRGPTLLGCKLHISMQIMGDLLNGHF